MDAEVWAWIAAIVAGSGVTKILGIAFRGRDAGMVLGPVLGTIGGIVAWQGAVRFAGIDGLNLVYAAGLGAVGGAALYAIGSLLLRKRAA